MPIQNQIVNNKSTELLGRILFTLIFILGCIEYVEAKSCDFEGKESVIVFPEERIDEGIAVEHGKIYIVEGTFIHNLEDAISSEIIYIKEEQTSNKEASKHKKNVCNKKETLEPKAKVAVEDIKHEFQFLETNKVPSSLYEISNEIKSVMPTSVSFKATFLKTGLTQKLISLLSDCSAEKKVQFSFYLLAGKTSFYLTSMAVRPPPNFA